ncbi:hypothetical protein [Roseovarius ramblicola]|uniref:TVP38/TMEM64 family membrane protein n=1 Tax=Roseovarius ramblicola TaxID=2022336 RepID=A0ABV5HZV9_9RHOB
MENSRPATPALPDPPPLKLGVARTLARLGLIAVLALALHFVFVWAEGWITRNEYGWAMPGLLLAVLMIYAVLIAIPFVPGVEIGLSVLAAGGAGIAPLVWLATATGLSLAFVVGCTVPIAWLRRVLTDLHMIRAAHLVARFEALPHKGRVAFAQSLLPSKYCGWIIRYRYVNLALLINIPGNSLIGGGGGIAFVSGLSGTFRAPLAILTIALATAPVPLAIWLFGMKLPWA